jgi:hypothetical protein
MVHPARLAESSAVTNEHDPVTSRDTLRATLSRTVLIPGLRKLALTAHLTLSIGWLGAVIAFLALAIAAVTSADTQLAHGACIAMGFLVSYVVVPIALVSLLSGLVSALGTKWGVFRYYWVIVKLVLSCIAVAILLKQVAPIRELAELARDPNASLAIPEVKRPLVHAAGGLVVLVVIQVIGVYKPWGPRKPQPEA